jgi:hypothetical protein
MNHEYTQEEDEAWKVLESKIPKEELERIERDSKKPKTTQRFLDLPNNDLND